MATQLVFMNTNKLVLPDIPIIGGQILLASDTNETYYDTTGNNRIRIDNVIYVYSEDDRKNYIDPPKITLFVVTSTAKFYKYRMDAGWIKVETSEDMYDLLDIVDELSPGTVYREGQKIAPRTLANLVYTADGSNVEDKLKCISKIGTTSDYFTITKDNQTEFPIPIPFENYFELGNFMEIFVGSTLIDKRRYYVDSNRIMINKPDEQFASGRDITFIFYYNSTLPPVNTTWAIDGNYIIDRSIPTRKLSGVYHNVDISNPYVLPSTVALNKAYTILSEQIRQVSGNLVIHAISSGPNGKELHIDVADYTLTDNKTIYLRLHADIQDGATLSVNDSGSYSIYLDYKRPIKSGMKKDDVLNLTYSAIYNKFFVNASIAYRLQHYSYTYTAIGGESEILIDMSEYEPGYDSVSVYQNNIRLVEEDNYRLHDRKILFIGYNASPGDKFLFEMDKVKGNGLPIDGNTIMKELVFTEHVHFLDGVDITGDLNIDGNINLNGELHFAGGATSGSNFTAEQFISTAEAPMPPLIVASDAWVENLNADKVDGYHAKDMVIPDNTLDFIIDGETDVLDPTIQVTFNAFYGRIDALDARMVQKDNPNRPKADKRKILDSIPEGSIDPSDLMYNPVVQDTVEDIVWKVDNLKYAVLKTEACEYNIDDLNNMTGDEFKPGMHEKPIYLSFYNNIAEMVKIIDDTLFDIERIMLTPADLDYVEPKVMNEIRAALREINSIPITAVYDQVPTIIPLANTQETATRAKYMMTDGKRIYPITHKNAIVGLPQSPLATQHDISTLQKVIDELTKRIEVLEATSGGGGVTGKAFTYVTLTQ